jgi:EEF1A lysine methyltransferase 2
MNLKDHWDKAYADKSVDKLGWHEPNLEPSMGLIRSLNLSRYAEIINVGAGASTLIEQLLEDGFQNITVNDISSVALDVLREQLGKEECNVEWVQDDLTLPIALKQLPMLDLWHDRAVLHFFVSEKDQLAYFNLLKQKVKSKGYVIIAAFSKGGAEKCAGLPVLQYDQEMISQRLGFDFELKQVLNHIFINPNGEERPYIYTLYQRK